MKPFESDSILRFYEVATILVLLTLLYFNVVKKGMEQLKSFTILLIAVLVITTRQYFISQILLYRLLPTTSVTDIDLVMGICLLALWTAGNYWKDAGKLFMLLYITWGLFFLISLPVSLQNLNLYIHWTHPAAVAETVFSSARLDVGSTLRTNLLIRESYLINSIKAALWLIFCMVVLIKTRREQLRMAV
jgi:hypothetical protein